MKRAAMRKSGTKRRVYNRFNDGVKVVILFVFSKLYIFFL